jgi:hypothetical protein
VDSIRNILSRVAENGWLSSQSSGAPRGHNVILIADPQNSMEAAQRLENTPIALAEQQDVAVRENGGSHTVGAGKRGQDRCYREVNGPVSGLPAGGEGAAVRHA